MKKALLPVYAEQLSMNLVKGELEGGRTGQDRVSCLFCLFWRSCLFLGISLPKASFSAGLS